MDGPDTQPRDADQAADLARLSKARRELMIAAGRVLYAARPVRAFNRSLVRTCDLENLADVCLSLAQDRPAP